ncbi:MAG: dipeptide epimerase [Gammaproteobacteria bacterium]|nr:MAG: dipeptide epimerase [Gammaproteobacteria bacterium]PIE36366.1 MAG: dipeptide epimerase [Gammaproteobacteria bacterium]
MSAGIALDVTGESFPIDGAFTISRGSRTEQQVVHVRLAAAGVEAQAECVPYAHYGESPDGVIRDIHGFTEVLAATTDAASARRELQTALPSGAARNALDCALWSLEARQKGVPVWQLAGLAAPEPTVTAYTLSLESPEAMHAAAARECSRPLLKLKLGGGPDDVERVAAVHAGAPQSTLIVDANEAWSVADYERLAPLLLDNAVAMVEQPFPAGDDAALASLERALPVCADEASHDLAGLAALEGRYDIINIKLDKTGGLTEALALAAAARESGLGIMVGCMVGTSLAMAPAFLLAAGARFVDLDGPLLLARDRSPAIRYEGSLMQPPEAALWG